MKRLTIEVGERKRIVHRISNSIPSSIRFTAEALGGGPASGTIEISANKVPGSKVTETRPLAEINTVEKTMWDSWFAIYVTPDQNVRIQFDKSQMQSSKLIWTLTGVVILAAVAVFLVPFFAN